MTGNLAPVLAFAWSVLPVAAATFVDVEGVERAIPDPSGAKATVVYFVTNDCPISNRYLPEIGRICDEYSQGARCMMAYVDPTLTADQIGEHRQVYGAALPALHDKDLELVELAGAKITPEAAVFDSGGRLVYRGRIDNRYASLGTPRRRATEHDLRNALSEVLAGKAVSRPRTQAVGCFIPTLKTARQQEIQ